MRSCGGSHQASPEPADSRRQRYQRRSVGTERISGLAGNVSMRASRQQGGVEGGERAYLVLAELA